MTYTQEQLQSILEAHAKWLRSEEGGSRADLRRADLRGADLSGTDLSGVDLSGANLRGANLNGAAWEQYTTEILPALLRAGVLPLEELLTNDHWNCHSWENCPMAAAFGVHRIGDIPPVHRLEASRFIELFDANALPLDKVREWCGLAATSTQ